MQSDSATANTNGSPPHAHDEARPNLAFRLPWVPVTGLLLMAGALLLYLRTLAPSVMQGDYAEFQFCAAILGVPHPTGYPLYILLGKLFTTLPFGDVAYRVNLSSAVYMACATGVLFALAVRLLRSLGWGRYWWAGAIGAAFFAVGPTVWSMSLVARAYALNALLVAGVAYCLVAWREAASSGVTRRATLYFGGACLLIGLSMVHHGTTYVLLPAYGLFLLLVEWEIHRRGGEAHPWRRRLLGVGALGLGYSPILFLAYRFVWGSPYYWGEPSTWRDFFDLISGGPFHNQVFGFGTGLDVQLGRLAFGVGELSAQYTIAGIALGLVGLIALWRLRWREALLVTLMLAGNFAFAMNYSVVGYLYFIPTYLVWGVFMAVGAGALARLVARVVRPAPARWGAGAVALAGAAALLAWAAAERLPTVDQSGQTAVRDDTLALLASVPTGSTIYTDWEQLSALRFYRLVYGMREDLTLHSGDPADWPRLIYCDISNGSAAYVTRFAGVPPPIPAGDFTLAQEPTWPGWRVTAVTNPDLYSVPPCGLCATCR